ncbi:MAG TPA: hypothetical protein VMF68_10315 [Spirochaetia bacterium]|nr:hypothetical protein [Spirochaetia bacterium]
MRNKVILWVLLISFAAAGTTWAQFWKGYTDDQRQKVAESYWLAGKQYTAVGKSDKGSEYMALAKVIYPQLDPASIKDAELPSAAELLAQGRTTTIGAGAGGIPSGSLNSFFLRFVTSMVERDAAGTAGFLDGSVYLARVPGEVSRSDAQSSFESFFKQQSMAGVEPSSVYDLATAAISPVSTDQRAKWGEAYTYSITAKADYPDLPFWESNQRFYIHKEGTDWYIFAIGQNPPLSFSPRKAPESEAQPPAAATDADARAAIQAAFQDCMESILKKDADTALTHMSDSIHFLRLRQTVTRNELKVTLEGYFDKPGFGENSLSDVLDTGSIFVQPVESPVDGITSAVYELNVRARADVSQSVPFWSDYQKYYFVQDGSNWLIFAIL